MSFSTPRLLAVFVALTVSAVAGRAEEPNKTDGHKLIGTWKLTSALYGGRAHKFPEGSTTLKHVTATQFMWVTYGGDGNVKRTAGGTYTIRGDAYEEMPAYGMSGDFDVIKGKPQKFTWKIEGNKWIHLGALSNGLTIEEVWERDDKK